MRKIFALLIAFLLVFPVTEAHAAENVYRLDELALSVTVPDELATFTRDTSKNDPDLATFGITKEQMDSMMTENNIYLNALTENGAYEIVVTMSKISMDDFYYLSDSDLSEIASSFVDGYAENGMQVIESEIYAHPQAKFLKIYLKHSSDSYVLQYYTIYDGKAISFNLHSYSGKLSVYQKGVIQQVVDSIEFDNTPQEKIAKETVPSTNAAVFANPFVEKIIVGAISGGLAGAFATLYYSMKKKRTQKAKTGKSYVQPTSPIEPTSPESTSSSHQAHKEALFCHKCGAKLPKDSGYCYRCGTKIEKME